MAAYLGLMGSPVTLYNRTANVQQFNIKPNGGGEKVSIFVFLHIITMFIAVAMSVGPELMLHRVAQSGDVRSIRAVFGAARPIGQLSAMIFGIGVIFGLIAAWLGKFNFLAPWLLIAYVLFIIVMALGGIVGRWLQQVGMAAGESGEGDPSPELTALLHNPMATYAVWANLAIITLIVLVMVLKPFS
jgi:Predicted integral membrane protein (DUF2269)